MDITVGVDLGGTKTAAALVDAEGAVFALHTIGTPAHEGPRRSSMRWLLSWAL